MANQGSLRRVSWRDDSLSRPEAGPGMSRVRRDRRSAKELERRLEEAFRLLSRVFGPDVTLLLGDSAGATKVFVQGADGIVVFSVDSDGKARILQGGAAFTYNAETGLAVQNNGATDKGAILSLIGGETTGNSQIAFGDKDDEFAGRVIYFHATNRFEFRTNGSATTHFSIGQDGRLGAGVASPNASAQVEVASTTRGFLPPRMTTTQRDAISSPAAGLLIYNTSLGKLNVYNGSAWEAVTSV